MIFKCSNDELTFQIYFLEKFNNNEIQNKAKEPDYQISRLTV